MVKNKPTVLIQPVEVDLKITFVFFDLTNFLPLGLDYGFKLTQPEFLLELWEGYTEAAIPPLFQGLQRCTSFCTGGVPQCGAGGGAIALPSIPSFNSSFTWLVPVVL